MLLSFVTPPLLTIFAHGSAQALGLCAWVLMAVLFQPTLQLYRLSQLWGFALPLIALCYLGFTIDSAVQCAQGRGGFWKGRIQAAGS
jgi:hypothetical protein